MDNKIFKPNKFTYFIPSIIFFSAAIFLVFYIVYGNLSFSEIMLSILCIIVGLYEAIKVFFFKITFNNSQIKITAEKEVDIAKRQYQTHAQYKEIVDINIVVSYRDSRNKTVAFHWTTPPRTFLVLTVKRKNGNQQRRFLIHFYTRKKQREIIHCIQQKCLEVGNNSLENLDIDKIFEDYKRQKKNINKILFEEGKKKKKN